MAKKLTQGKILTAMARDGARIMKTYVNEPPSSAGVVYRLTTTGETVRSDLVCRLLADGLILEANDGLDLLGGTSQTYERVTNL